MDPLDAPLGSVPGVSTQTASRLRVAFGITTVRGLLEHYPHQDKYRAVGGVVALRDAEVGAPATVVGTLGEWTRFTPKRKLAIAKAHLSDESGGVVEVSLFNQPWVPRSFPRGSRVAASGTLERFRTTLQLRNPKLTHVEEDVGVPDVGDRVDATYPATEQLSSERIAGAVAAVLDWLPPVPDPVPDLLLARHGLIDLDTAVRGIHRPAEQALVRPARARLVYDELLTLQLGLQQRRDRLERDAVGLDNRPVDGGLAARFLDRLPFAPTRAQRRAMEGIGADLARPKPMHRLLQGDVGSGKTLVAAWAMLCAVDQGRQAALMVPTEVLAEQHLRTLTALLAPLGVNVLDGPRIDLLTGSTPLGRRRGLLAQLAVGDLHMVVGTHALLTDVVTFDDLGVVVVDEQHRFGVEHRTRLRDKRPDASTPDVLVMTATPIPRSLALTVYGDLDVTVLDELPPGRQPITTQVIATGSPRREGLWRFVRERVAAGERAYVVTPLVEHSDALAQVAAAEEVHRRLATETFPDLAVGLVHGRLSAAQRDAVMDDFRHGAVQVLVATTVIEVGVDVPEATIMVIEDADRFGISQLHQLRGRVGRGSAPSWCVLFTAQAAGNGRLDALAATTDGFELAERDLALRGEGSLFDTRQSGLPDLRLARLGRDTKVIGATRADARDLIAADPELAGHPALAAEVARRYGAERLEALRTG